MGEVEIRRENTGLARIELSKIGVVRILVILVLEELLDVRLLLVARVVLVFFTSIVS